MTPFRTAASLFALATLLGSACNTPSRSAAAASAPSGERSLEGAPLAPGPPLPSPLPPRLLRTLAHNPAGYDPSRSAVATDLLLGDLLFHSSQILGPRARDLGLSCQTCHPNGATHGTLFLDGVSDRPGNVDLTTAHFRAGADDGIANAVNIPSLRGVRYTAPYGRDGRTASLAEFTQGVIASEFGGDPLPPPRLAALVHYLQDLDFLPNPFLDERGRLGGRAGPSARRGEKLFFAARPGLGGASCATCHDPSSYFRDGRVHRLAGTRRASPYGLDDGYETPTLLGLVESRPYFHDGRFATLAEVVAWFDAAYHLGLTPKERNDLTAYLEAVGAAELAGDARALGERLADAFVYLELLLDGEAAGDRAIWSAAVDAARRALATLDGGPPALTDRKSALAERLISLRAVATSGAALEGARPEARSLRIALDRFAADWTGWQSETHKATP